MMQLLKVVDAEKSDAEKLLEQLNIRCQLAGHFNGTQNMSYNYIAGANTQKDQLVTREALFLYIFIIFCRSLG